jgi:hypothetical protein
VRLRCGSDWFALAREHSERPRTLKEGIMFMTCGQSTSVLTAEVHSVESKILYGRKTC